MKIFRSSLFVQTSTSSDYNLPETACVRVLSFPFTVGPRHDYLYTYDGAINVYTTAPLNLVKKIEYKADIKNLLLTSEALFILNDNALIMHSRDTFHTLPGSFQEGKLIDMRGCTQGSKDAVAVQGKSALAIYDGSFKQTALHRCQCSYSTRDILLLGDFNMLVVMINGKRSIEIAVPDRITALICDQLFSKVFCACLGGDIYALSMEGEPPQRMEYHKASVENLKMSFCGKYLYSADAGMVCVWNTCSYAVIGFFECDKPIQGLDIVLEGNRTYGDIPIQLH